jgi:hypothetical protein
LIFGSLKLVDRGLVHREYGVKASRNRRCEGVVQRDVQVSEVSACHPRSLPVRVEPVPPRLPIHRPTIVTLGTTPRE